MARLIAVLLPVLYAATAQATVVADSACPYYAVDIAAFATCDGDRVASSRRPVAATRHGHEPSRDATQIGSPSATTATAAPQRPAPTRTAAPIRRTPAGQRAVGKT